MPSRKSPRPEPRARGPIHHDDRTMSIARWGREVGLDRNTIRERLVHGWSVSDALTRPLQRNQYRATR